MNLRDLALTIVHDGCVSRPPAMRQAAYRTPRSRPRFARCGRRQRPTSDDAPLMVAAVAGIRRGQSAGSRARGDRGSARARSRQQPEYLRARATLATWAAHYDRARNSYRQLARMQPLELDVTLNYARVSAWAGDTEQRRQRIPEVSGRTARRRRRVAGTCARRIVARQLRLGAGRAVTLSRTLRRVAGVSQRARRRDGQRRAPLARLRRC